jgi:nitroreductase
MQKPAITQVAINDTIANRWSGRAYDDSQVVSHEQMIAMLEAARWAPSCYGDQPWRFVVLNKNTDPQSWQQAFDCLSPGNQTWAINAPVLLVVCADSLFQHNQQPNRWAQYDTGAAVENLCLQATSMGLMAHQMGGFNADAARQSFIIPEQYTLMAIISIGYPAPIEALEGEVLTRETAQRTRRQLNELFFAGQWGQPVSSSK